LFFVRGALVERDPELEGARRPTCTVEEIPGYIWSRSRDGREKDQPVKADDHGMDAMRYMVAHRDLAEQREVIDRKSTRLNSSHVKISYAVFCLKKKKKWSNHEV